MSKEQEREAQYAFDAMLGWIITGFQTGTISNWVLQGPVGDTKFQTFAGVFPQG